MSDHFVGQLETHLPRMYRVALRIVGDTDRARDVAQDACVKALRGSSGFGGRSGLATWLHRITVNCAMDQLRRQKRSTQTETVENLELAGVRTVVSTTPAVLAERRELFAHAVAMIERLPDDCRGAFVLTQLDGYSYDDAAVIEGQPRGTVASRVHRAKRILMEQLTDLSDGRACK